MTPKYPQVKVQLVGKDGYAYFILGRIGRAMRAAGLSKEVRDQFRKEATSGDYDHLLRTCMEWVDCDGGADCEEDES